jgi:hypothetical protein
MRPMGGFGALAPGAISVTAQIADERICSIRVASSRPTHLTRLFVDRSAAEVPALAERLYSLCGFSHALAAKRAIAAARGDMRANNCSTSEAIGLLCERLNESLRSTAASSVGDRDAFAVDNDIAAVSALHTAFSLTRELMTIALSGPRPNASNRMTIERCAEGVRAAVSELGVSFPHDRAVASPSPDSWFGRLRRQLEGDQGFVASVPDSLEPDDDDTILEQLRNDSEGFAALPSLAGRAPETGAFARLWRHIDVSSGALPARLDARMIDIAQLANRLVRATADQGDRADLRSVALASREGFAAVETARGVLYHWVRLAADDRVREYAIVAPTEWNFHPAGPFVAAALGARACRDLTRRSLARLAALFDPCVALHVDVLESIDA